VALLLDVWLNMDFLILMMSIVLKVIKRLQLPFKHGKSILKCSVPGLHLVDALYDSLLIVRYYPLTFHEAVKLALEFSFNSLPFNLGLSIQPLRMSLNDCDRVTLTLLLVKVYLSLRLNF
jgi:hypothetical protein